MTRAWILMTAMPPTKGHLNLIRFGASLASEVHVIVCTQPGEPMAKERFWAVRNAAKNINYSRVFVYDFHKETEQDPDAHGFWDMWKDILEYPSRYMPVFTDGVAPEDFIIASEPYGNKLAEITGTTFMPYDPNRELFFTKAEDVRNDVESNFDQIMPEFQHSLRYDVTIFGAESTGKTTLSKQLAENLNGHWFFEWARPYLETVGPEITVGSMTAIWNGQKATQLHSFDFYNKPYAFFDTDLFSTVGYWEQPHWEAELGPVPEGLVRSANRLKSDLYIITKSNIPFEEDVIRYGGDRRESPDEYWIGIAKKYGLNYVVLKSTEITDRVLEASKIVRENATEKFSKIQYERKSNG